MIQKYLVGTFDGKYHNIKNLKIGGQLNFEEGETGGTGFFSMCYGTIKNINLIFDTSINITNTDKFVSAGLLVGIVGYRNGEIIEHEGTIENCMVDGKINIVLNGRNFNLGGLVGAVNGTIKNCSNKTNINIESSLTESLRIGGICGSVDRNSVITNCFNSGDITMNQKVDIITETHIGGNVGKCGNFGEKITNIYNIGNINYNSSFVNGRIEIGFCVGRECATCSELYSNTWFSLDNLIKTENSNCKILDNVTKKTSTELSGKAGVTLLNTNNEDKVWVEDTNRINKGYPILNWQTEN